MISVLVTDGFGSFGDIKSIVTQGLTIGSAIANWPALITDGFGSFSSAKYVIAQGLSLEASPPVVGAGNRLIMARRRRR